MSANLVLDLRQTTQHYASVVSPSIVASGIGPGTLVGGVVDFLTANAFCQVFVAGGGYSGVLRYLVQTSDSTTSGSFVDPTSGIPTAALPPGIHSGGVFIVNSGLWQSGGPFGSVMSGAPRFASGGIEFGAFLRPHRYARLVQLSGGSILFQSGMTAIGGFVSQLKTTSSGGGTTLSPASGVSGGATVFV